VERVIVDSFESYLPRPSQNERQKRLYSGVNSSCKCNAVSVHWTPVSVFRYGISVASNRAYNTARRFYLCGVLWLQSCTYKLNPRPDIFTFHDMNEKG